MNEHSSRGVDRLQMPLTVKGEGCRGDSCNSVSKDIGAVPESDPTGDDKSGDKVSCDVYCNRKEAQAGNMGWSSTIFQCGDLWKRKRAAIIMRLQPFVITFDGAEEKTRTFTGEPPLDPEPSASTNSATSATGMNMLPAPRFVKPFLGWPGK
jgi:hypothetical protein